MLSKNASFEDVILSNLWEELNKYNNLLSELMAAYSFGKLDALISIYFEYQHSVYLKELIIRKARTELLNQKIKDFETMKSTLIRIKDTREI